MSPNLCKRKTLESLRKFRNQPRDRDRMRNTNERKIFTGSEVLRKSAETPAIPTIFLFSNLPTVLKVLILLVGNVNVWSSILSLLLIRFSGTLLVLTSIVNAKLTIFLNVLALSVKELLCQTFHYQQSDLFPRFFYLSIH